jgi:hypothetical protein
VHRITVGLCPHWSVHDIVCQWLLVWPEYSSVDVFTDTFKKLNLFMKHSPSHLTPGQADLFGRLRTPRRMKTDDRTVRIITC